MAVPKRRTSRSRRNHRRSHDGVAPVQVQYCRQCNEPVLPHRACPHCGYYQGRTAIAVSTEDKTRT